MELKQILEWLKATIESNFTAAVVSLKQHIPTVKLESNKVEVTNPLKLPKQYAVKVLNPTKDYSKELASLKADFVKSLDKVTSTILSIKPSNSVRINNVKDIVIPEFPKEVKISNPQEKVTVIGLSTVTDGLSALKKAIEKLPTSIPEGKEEVTVKNLKDLKESFAEIVKAVKDIKPSSFTSVDMRSDDPTKSIPVRLTDGEKFYKAIEDFVLNANRTYAYSNGKGERANALIDADRHVQVDVVTMPTISIPPVIGGATEVKQDDEIAALIDVETAIQNIPATDVSSLATSAKQLPDGHAVEVNNLPTEYPLPASQVSTLTPPAPITGFSTSTKQDTGIVTLQDLHNQISFLLDRLEFGMITDKSKTLKVQISPDLTSNIGTVTTITGATVTAVNNTLRQGDLQMQRVNEALMDTAFIVGITNHLTF